MRNTFFLILLLALFQSCSHKNQFPEYLTQKVSSEHLTVKILDTIQVNKEKDDSLKDMKLQDCLEELSTSVRYFKNKNQNFSFKNLKENWDECKNKLSGLKLNGFAQEKWVEATGLLLQLTAEAKYAEELERIFFKTGKSEIKENIAGYVITKNVDHLHVNLFIPAEIEYEHSLKGKVSMVQETNYPESGKTELKFSMEKKRYVELFIRIPSWEENAHVTVMGVKYLAPAGKYCKIAKQWEEGDTVEIVFPDVHKHTF